MSRADDPVPAGPHRANPVAARRYRSPPRSGHPPAPAPPPSPARDSAWRTCPATAPSACGREMCRGTAARPIASEQRDRSRVMARPRRDRGRRACARWCRWRVVTGDDDQRESLRRRRGPRRERARGGGRAGPARRGPDPRRRSQVHHVQHPSAVPLDRPNLGSTPKVTRPPTTAATRVPAACTSRAIPAAPKSWTTVTSPLASSRR